MPEWSDSKTPNGGWQFFQPQTKFSLDRKTKPSSVSVTLDQAAELVQKHRMQNPSFGLPIEFYKVRQEIVDFNRTRLGFSPDDLPPKFTPQRQSRAAAVVASANKTAAGVQIVADWLGSGLLPVPQAEAERRANICVTCPQNQTGTLWQRLEGGAAIALKKLVAIKGELSLTTTHDANLKTCVACDCHLPLKVWTPLPHIVENTAPEVRAALDPRCWVLQ